MCGINGIYAWAPRAPAIDVDELRRTTESMSARGPDASGRFVASDLRLGLGHRRLSIIDLSDSANQPMWDRTGRYCIVFNGEIFNYLELRRVLESKGERFSTQSDTEVLLTGFGLWGIDVVDRLRGMFAFAIWDTQRRRLTLSRDHLGIKPIYYQSLKGTFRFASQVRALLAGGGTSQTFDPVGLATFYLWGSVAEPNTIVSGIKQIPAAHVLEIGPDGVGDPERYWDAASVYRTSVALSRPQARELTRTVIRDSVDSHLVSDVPVGLFLSSGIDSSVLLTHASELSSEPLHTVSLRFEEFHGAKHDESPLAESLARRFGTHHKTITVTRSDFDAARDTIMQSMDQPTIDGVNTFFVSHAGARAGLKVALSGAGADEVFGGYPSFKNVPWLSNATRLFRMLPKRWRVVWQPTNRRLAKAFVLLNEAEDRKSPYRAQRGLFMPWELSALMEPDAAEFALDQLAQHDPIEAPDEEPLAMTALLEQSVYLRNQLLRDTDWASMAHSLEVRVPFVDRTVYERLASAALVEYRRNATKRLLADSVGCALPAEVKSRPKTGFAVPLQQWLSRDVPEDRPLEHWSRSWARIVASQFRSLLRPL
ncbi:MAG: asparagine synthase (glutamine-hydrolyzing) [Myxococcota bacterium]